MLQPEFLRLKIAAPRIGEQIAGDLRVHFDGSTIEFPAEVFAQLIQRAHELKDYARIDALAGVLAQRLAPSEVCELARSPNVVVRALAHEALAQMPATLLIMLLRDPVDAAVARYALQRQATEYNSEEARQALQELDEFGLEQF